LLRLTGNDSYCNHFVIIIMENGNYNKWKWRVLSVIFAYKTNFEVENIYFDLFFIKMAAAFPEYQSFYHVSFFDFDLSIFRLSTM